MNARINIVGKTVNYAVIPITILLLLSGCAAPADQTSWEHVHDGLLIGNIYTGDDHI